MRMDSTFRIEPGRRVLVLSHLGSTDMGQVEMVMDAVEGKTYVVKSDAIGMNIRFWIEDETGRMIGKKEVPREPAARTAPVPLILPMPGARS